MTRLTLRPISVADVAFLELHLDPEYAFFAVDRTPSGDDLLAEIDDTTSANVDYRVALDADGPAGWIRLDHDLPNGTAVLGYGFEALLGPWVRD